MNKLLFGAFVSLCLLACSPPGEKPASTDEVAADTAAAKPAEVPQSEFADAKYTELGKKASALFANGDIDNWLTAYADNARYNWSAGDSLVGKEAIGKYWKDRRANTVESLKFSNQIWLPLKVNKPQATEEAGTWLLNWYQIDAKYKTGKSISFWAHTAHHFNANDLIDQTILYIDRVPIVAASTK